MATPGVHVCLLSDQLLPNLIPVLMERPARVYLVATAEMVAKGRDKRMRRLLRRENIDTRIRGGAPSTRIKEIRRFADRLAQEMKKNEAGGTIVLNATGGTKLLSMGFVEVFRERLEGYPLRVVLYGYGTSGDRDHRTSRTGGRTHGGCARGRQLSGRSGDGARFGGVRWRVWAGTPEGCSAQASSCP